jgi:hypothetical protein
MDEVNDSALWLSNGCLPRFVTPSAACSSVQSASASYKVAELQRPTKYLEILGIIHKITING